jgi:hypothetical protein
MSANLLMKLLATGLVLARTHPVNDRRRPKR